MVSICTHATPQTPHVPLKSFSFLQLLIHGKGCTELVKRKYLAIYGRFIDSYIPPKLQISIPEDMAASFSSKPGRISPYIFRLPQVRRNSQVVQRENTITNPV